MPDVSVVAELVEPFERIAARLEEGAAVAGYKAERPTEDTVTLRRRDTPWWLFGLFAPLAKRERMVVVRAHGSDVTATGTADGTMAAFLDVCLEGADRPALSPRLREIAAGR